jgi:regulator of nucleoside diphosphate kinase
MYNDNTPVVLCEEDYNRLSKILEGRTLKPNDEMTLAHEIKRAIVVRNEAFPANTIRINSFVKVKDLETNREKEFQIVMPSDANIRDRKISIFSPMAAALIGFRLGDEVTWEMPSGLKKLKIIEVANI